MAFNRFLSMLVFIFFLLVPTVENVGARCAFPTEQDLLKSLFRLDDPFRVPAFEARKEFFLNQMRKHAPELQTWESMDDFDHLAFLEAVGERYPGNLFGLENIVHNPNDLRAKAAMEFLALKDGPMTELESRRLVLKLYWLNHVPEKEWKKS